MSGSARRAGRILLLALGVLAAAGCEHAGSLGGEPGLLTAIQRYYELNALEEGGSCSAPLLDGVTRSRVVENPPGRFEVDLAYYYRDMIRDDCDPLPNAGCRALRECRGFAERSFVVGREQDRLRVLEMSGPKKGRVRHP